MVQIKDLISELEKLDQNKEIYLWNCSTSNYEDFETRIIQDKNMEAYEIIEK